MRVGLCFSAFYDKRTDDDRNSCVDGFGSFADNDTEEIQGIMGSGNGCGDNIRTAQPDGSCI